MMTSSASRLASVSSSPTPQILIVEDEQIIALNLRELLESLGYQVLGMVASAEKAIAKATELRPDLVLMDICLKGEMDGIYAAEQIWTMLQIPVIYVTGHSDPTTLNRAKATAPFGYILKPIREKELCIAIETAIERCTRERLLLSVFRGMGDGVIVTDTQQRVQFLNSMAETLTGWTLMEARDCLLPEVFNVVDPTTGESMLDRLIHMVLNELTPIYLEYPLTLINKQGNAIPISDSFASFKDNAGEVVGLVIVFRNITERLLAEERDRAVEQAHQLEAQLAEMQRLNLLKEDFLSTISHELRTPLSNIQLATRMLSIVLDQLGILAQTPDGSNTALNRYIQILQEQSEQELRLVNDLLDLQRINAESYPLDLSILQLQDWLPHILEAFVDRTTTNRQTLDIQITPQVSTLQTDAHLLTRIVSELMNNACKYTPPDGKIVVSVDEADTSTDTGRSQVVIQVSNSGVEISPEETERIFEPFYRIPQCDRWAKGGTGLGLALVKKFVGYLGGHIDVTSTDGQVTFQVSLPSQSADFWPSDDETADQGDT